MARSLPLTAAAGILILDQATKAWLASALPFGGERAVTPWFSLVHWHNPGGIFGMLDRLPEWGRLTVFLAVPLLGVSLLGYLYSKSPRASDRWLLAAILGGAAGNLLDRIRFGAVVDFLYFHIPEGPGWPAFNVADATLSTGILVFVALMFLRPEKEKDRASDPLSRR
jgi:signal peptidase II